MSTQQPTSAAVVHHHHYYGSDHAPVPARPAWNPQCRHETPARTSPSPALLLAAGAGITVALVVAVTVATALAVLAGLIAVVVLGARHYAQIERDARAAAPTRSLPGRDARGRFTA